VTLRGRTVVMDFGSRAVWRTPRVIPKRRAAHRAEYPAGTVPHMSPEQLKVTR
jgi:hypothetical protein